MMTLKRIDLDLELGSFHKVKGVSVSQQVVSILSRDTEYMLPVAGVYDPIAGTRKEIQVANDYPLKGTPQGFQNLTHLNLGEVVSINVTKPDPYGQIRITNEGGLTLVWDIFA